MKSNYRALCSISKRFNKSFYITSQFLKSIECFNTNNSIVEKLVGTIKKQVEKSIINDFHSRKCNNCKEKTFKMSWYLSLHSRRTNVLFIPHVMMFHNNISFKLINCLCWNRRFTEYTGGSNDKISKVPFSLLFP